MQHPLSRRHLLLPIAAAALCACHGESRHVHPPVAPFDVWEQEPNDAHCCANDLGWIGVGDEFVIGGSIRDDNLDPFDGFQLRALGPCSVRFALEPLNGVSDLDLCVWDPLLANFAFCFESSAAVEQGVFNVPNSGAAFHLVVASYIGDSEYRLWVRCEPIGLGLNAGEAPPAESSSPKAGQFDAYRPLEEEPARRAALGPAWMLEYDPQLDQIELRAGAWRRVDEEL